jgi:N6-adenosine-specific RNA methylase IME4
MRSRRSLIQTEPLFGKPGHFRTLLGDPAWPERGAGKIKRGANRHYDVIGSKEEILEVMKSCPYFDMADNAHGYIWVSNRFLKWGIYVLEGLGFDYVTNIAWKKRQAGLGRYFRGKHELLLFGVRGRGMDPTVMTDRKDIDSAFEIDHPRDDRGTRIHSRKPVEFHELIEARSRGPYLEMFARQRRPGWTVWGNDPEVVNVQGGASTQDVALVL